MTSQRQAGRTTIYHVARHAGLSSSTVSRVLSGRGQIAESTRAAVLRAAAELGYRPNSVARNLARQVSDTLAILLPDITNPFFPSLVREIQAEAERRGFTVLLCNTRDDPAAERQYLDALLSRQVEHVICAGLVLDEPAIQEYIDAGLTFIAIDRSLSNADTYLVHSDNRAGARLAVEHLLGLGHRRIAHLAGPDGVDVTRLRREGYLDALSGAGVELGDEFTVPTPFTEEGGAAAFRELRERSLGETAIFAANDLVAIGALFAAHEQGLDVPRDLSIVGFDDVSLAKYVTPQLTTVRQDVGALARVAVDISTTSSRSAAPSRQTTLPVELVVRQSTTRPRSPRARAKKKEN